MNEATRQEPAPTQGQDIVFNALMDDLRQRALFGIAKYGQPLMTRDGRDSLTDLYQEILDAAMYVKKLIMERSALSKSVIAIPIEELRLMRAFEDCQLAADHVVDSKVALAMYKAGHRDAREAAAFLIDLKKIEVEATQEPCYLV